MTVDCSRADLVYHRVRILKSSAVRHGSVCSATLPPIPLHQVRKRC